MPTVSIKPKMTCASCVNGVKGALEALPFVTSVAVDLAAQTATCEVAEGGGCECVKTNGKCPCGDKCKCAATKMVAAVEAAGYAVTPCGTGKGPCPAVALGSCTCGPDCQCGPDCSCASCPAKCGTGLGPCPAAALGTCTCGPECQCGPNCQCAACPGGAKPAAGPRTIHISIDIPSLIIVTGALALGFVLGQKAI
mmetsp:Transcript_19439/g.57820  ORF Transcript_19439/g.57820 Transcript_19439/m.57820 type:complete len:196 (-) Transcript_19439:43-630(-)